MSHPGEDERWLDVLAGRQAGDKDTRSATLARGYFEKRAQAESAPRPDDARREQRLLDAMRARGLLDEAPLQRPSWRQILAQWFTLGPGRAPRYALAGLMAMAVAVAITPLLLREPAGDEGMKSGQAAQADIVVPAEHPQATADRLASVLNAAGLQATTRQEGKDLIVETRVPADARNGVQAALMNDGIVLPPDGHLVLRVRPAP